MHSSYSSSTTTVLSSMHTMQSTYYAYYELVYQSRVWILSRVCILASSKYYAYSQSSSTTSSFYVVLKYCRSKSIYAYVLLLAISMHNNMHNTMHRSIHNTSSYACYAYSRSRSMIRAYSPSTMNSTMHSMHTLSSSILKK